MQQGNVLLKKINRNELSSGMNTLVNEMKNLNKSYSKDASMFSADETLNGTYMGNEFEFNDPAFQLDSGKNLIRINKGLRSNWRFVELRMVDEGHFRAGSFRLYNPARDKSRNDG